MDAAAESRIPLKAVVRYDGTDFAGWQVQPNARTVQGELESALSRLAGEAVTIHGAGRTDAGVHALGQAFHCLWPEGAPYGRIARAVSSMLAPHIRILSVEPAPPGFHARYGAAAKTYAYTFSNERRPDPFTARYAWTLPGPVDVDALRRLCHRIEGAHDFAGYQCSKAAVVEDTVRTLHRVSVEPGPLIGPRDARDHWHVVFHGDGFLYKMVRNLMGTMIDVARGRLPESAVEAKLHEAGPYRGFTAPAKGLALVSVDYLP